MSAWVRWKEWIPRSDRRLGKRCAPGSSPVKNDRGMTPPVRPTDADDTAPTDMNTLPYGTWPSPITPDAIVAETVRLASVSLDAGRLGWLEGRPGEGGRNVLVRANDARRIRPDVTPYPRPSTCGRACTNTAAARTCRISATGCGSPTSTTAESIRSRQVPRRRAPADRGWPGPVRGPDRRPGMRRRLLAVRETHRDGATAGQRPGRDLHRRRFGAGARLGARLLRGAGTRAPTVGGLRGSPGTSPTCPGMRRTLWLAEFDRDGIPGDPGPDRGRVGVRGVPAGVVARRGSVVRRRPRGMVESPPLARRRPSLHVPGGERVRQALVAARDDHVRIRRRTAARCARGAATAHGGWAGSAPTAR